MPDRGAAMGDESNNWRATKHRLKQRWPGLADDELEASHGERSALVALLEGHLGYARTNAEQDLDQILSGETVVPEDVADESTHTGTSGPVGFAGADFSGDPGENGVPTTSDAAQRTPPWQLSGGRSRMIKAVSFLAMAATLLM